MGYQAIVVRAVVTVVTLGWCCVVPAAGQDPGASPALPSAASIVARHVEAIGGSEAYLAVQSMHARGRFEIPAQGIIATFEMYAARPARMLQRVTVPGLGRIETGHGGTVGWLTNPLTGPEILTGQQLDDVVEDAWFDAPLRGSARVADMTTIERTTFDDRPAWRVRVVFRAGREQIDFYDVDTGLLIGSESTRATPQGMVPTTAIYRNYQRFGALLQATTVIQRALGFEQVLTVTAVEYDRVPDEIFTLPAEVSALLPSR
jgi:hypothetical protein